MSLSNRLDDLARNLRWDWHAPTRSLFRALDPDLWERVDHNPVALLRRLDRAALDRPELADRVAELWRDLQAYLDHDAPRPAHYRAAGRPMAAYFSAEFGLTGCLRIYSGGLGVLAGDHLKSASDLGLPLVAVGLLYREGYFRQQLDGAGAQTARYPVADFDDLPIRAASRPDDDAALRVTVPFPGRQVAARVWRADVGRVPLYLLDTDVPGNADADRRITARLYGGDNERRLAQELILGVGGYRTLIALGLRPETFHMNEGHSAFLALELTRDIMRADDVGFDLAADRTRARCVFTTHTPVPAGHDRFPKRLVAAHLTETAHGLGLSIDELMDLGRAQPGAGPLNMTVLAIRLSRATNGVSALHARVSREMWRDLWPERDVEDVPIDHVTNGVHAASWIHGDVAAAAGIDVERAGLDDDAPAPDPDIDRLWRVHEARRSDLVAYVRERTGTRLDPDVLTIAFARRFATYKRATLVFSDPDRLAALLNDPARPAQLVFAGKAHPKDEGGQALIARIGELARDTRLADRIAFVPDYGIDVARKLVQGADVWLNNPRRPMEASGTSGMKAAMNGALNLSILDGWWDEAWAARDPDAPPPGWAIVGDHPGVTWNPEAPNPGAPDPGAPDLEAVRDRADAAALYEILERDVVPTFYRRDDAGVPREWVAMMAESIRRVVPFFTTHRMLRDYVDRYRVPAARSAADSAGD